MLQENVIEMKTHISNYTDIIRNKFKLLEESRQKTYQNNVIKTSSMTSEVLDIVDDLGILTSLVTILNLQINSYIDQELSGFVIKSDEFDSKIKRQIKLTGEMYVTIHELLRVCTFHLNVKEIWRCSVVDNLESLNKIIFEYIDLLDKSFNDIQNRKQFHVWTKK